ncbi:MAG: RNA ligase (ATP) [Candidatus Sericytochromatia bacterium]
MRNLATIQKIISIEPIENADSIEKVTVLGWNVVVKKNEFKLGELVVYIEIDSLLPELDIFEFLRNKKFIIKTVRLRGQISQGICFPLGILENFISSSEINNLKEGDEVTDIIGITKYEPPLPLNMGGNIKGLFPSFIPKTDETRAQVLPQIIERYTGTECFITEKVDGSSMTIYIKDGEFGVCSRNMEMTKDINNIFWATSEKLGLENKLKNLSKILNIEDISVQGELIGNGMQGNKYKINGNKFLAFNIFDINSYKYIDFKEFFESCEKSSIETVPLLDEKFILNHSISELVELSKGNSKLNSQVKREGIVIRSIKEITNVEKIGRFSFKSINPEFLLKYNE